MPQNKLKRDDPVVNQNELPGFPGYRLREGRSGLDPLDTDREAAHMEGTFYRNLFTLKLRTRDGFYLILMFVFGVIPFPFLLYIMVNSVLDAIKDWQASNLILPPSILLFTGVSGFLAANFILSLLEMAGILPSSRKDTPGPVRERRKKMPRRRKDFR